MKLKIVFLTGDQLVENAKITSCGISFDAPQDVQGIGCR
jgi:hypothetical protein